MSPDTAPLLTTLLEQVSRSFYKTLWILPRSVRSPISLAYLLARASDTIADTELVPCEERLEALRRFRGRISGASSAALDFGALAARQASDAERTLLQRAEEACALLDRFPEKDRGLIRAVLETITSGQELDLQRFAGDSREGIVALKNDEELDDYTYRVAGCVGEFWTEMCWAHVFQVAQMDQVILAEPSFTALGIRFGKGLQLVNILRDLPADLRQGRCYLPEEKLRAARLEPSDLLEPANEPRFRPLYHSYLDLAQEHLAAGWRYTNVIPRSSPRVRLACAWPVLIGVRTLALLREGNILDPSRRIKVSRREIKGIVGRSVLSMALPPLWRGLFTRNSAKATALI
ncbi:MAG: farnesyl-diphosphate farnesyltransferase [Verrucomicrobiota bacterium]|jgi:farnesyl-diphosphate farnesyltransferase